MKPHISLRTKDAVTGFLFTLPALVGLGMFHNALYFRSEELR